MEVKNLIEYMEIVCGKIMSYPLESNHTDNKYLSQMNSIGKEFILRTSSQSGIKTDKKIPEELCEILRIGQNEVYKMLKNKEIVAYKVGKTWRIPKENVIQYIKSKIP